MLSLEEVTTLPLPVGEHDVTLLVIDSLGDESIETTKVIVRKCWWPVVDELSPNEGSTSGGDEVTITGSGFSTAISVQFGLVELSGNDIDVVDDTTIKVLSPPIAIGVPVEVSVTIIPPEGDLDLAESNSEMFTFISTVPIKFEIALLSDSDFQQPTAVAIGPDGKLYAGNGEGQIGKFTLNEDYTAVESVDVIAEVAPNRYVMGM